MFFRIHAFQGPGFLGSRFFRVQVFQGPGFSGSRIFRVRVHVLEVAPQDSFGFIKKRLQHRCFPVSYFSEQLLLKIYLQKLIPQTSTKNRCIGSRNSLSIEGRKEVCKILLKIAVEKKFPIFSWKHLWRSFWPLTLPLKKDFTAYLLNLLFVMVENLRKTVLSSPIRHFQ